MLGDYRLHIISTKILVFPVACTSPHHLLSLAFPPGSTFTKFHVATEQSYSICLKFPILDQITLLLVLLHLLRPSRGILQDVEPVLGEEGELDAKEAVGVGLAFPTAEDAVHLFEGLRE